MKKKRKRLIAWHTEEVRNKTQFNFQLEMERYCCSDVEILRKTCLKFRQLFLDLVNVDPLAVASTTASVCMNAYHTSFSLDAD